MPKGKPDFQVLIPYKDLCALLEAAQKVDDLNNRYTRLERKFEKLQERFLEVMIAFGDLKRFVND